MLVVDEHAVFPEDLSYRGVVSLSDMKHVVRGEHVGAAGHRYVDSLFIGPRLTLFFRTHAIPLSAYMCGLASAAPFCFELGN